MPIKFGVSLQDKLDAARATKTQQQPVQPPVDTCQPRATSIITDAHLFLHQVAHRFGTHSHTYRDLLAALLAFRRHDIDALRLYVKVFLIFRASTAPEWFAHFNRFLPPSWQTPPLLWLQHAIVKSLSISSHTNHTRDRLLPVVLPPLTSVNLSARANGPLSVAIKYPTDNTRKRKSTLISEDCLSDGLKVPGDMSQAVDDMSQGKSKGVSARDRGRAPRNATAVDNTSDLPPIHTQIASGSEPERPTHKRTKMSKKQTNESDQTANCNTQHSDTSHLRALVFGLRTRK